MTRSGGNQIVAVVQPRNKARDFLRVILPVAVQGHDVLAATRGEAVR